jgi:hypothetical protein
MKHEVTHTAIVGSGPAMLVGTAAGQVMECAIGAAPSPRPFTGLEGSVITSLSISASGTVVMAGDAAGNVRVWNRDDGAIVDAWRGEYATVQCAMLGPREYLTVDQRRNGRIWRPGANGGVEASAVVQRLGEACQFDRFAAGPGEDRVVLLSGFRWMVWDRRENSVTEEHEPVEGLKLVYMAGQVGLSSNGQFYFVYWDDYTVIDTVAGRELWTRDILLSPTAAVISGDAQVLMLGGPKGKIFAVGPDGESTTEIQFGEAAIREVALSADGRIATFVNSQGAAGVIDVPRRRVILSPEELDGLL